MHPGLPLCLVGLSAIGLAACAGTAPDPASPTVDRESCATEAQLLATAARALDAPERGADVTYELAAGTSVYPCGTARGYRAVMFPAPGERADCSTRPPDRLCPTGFLPLTAGLETAG